MTQREYDTSSFCENNSRTLLKEYDIPVTHLDFEYVKKCENAKELERIFHVLKSGQEGHYPDLLRMTEERLRLLMPKSRFLRNLTRVKEKQDLNENEWQVLSEDLSEWMRNVSKYNKELEYKKKTSTSTKDISKTSKIRQTKTLQDEDKRKRDDTKRIKSTDYANWDKYDPDTEILKMDLEEEKIKKDAAEKQAKETSQRQNRKTNNKKQIKFNEFPTEAEANYEANREREIGNEYYKSGEYDAALTHYDASLRCKTTVQCLNNRAMTYVKLNRHPDALEDCERALALEPRNFRANFRKAQALERLERYKEGLEVVEMCVRIEPNNDAVQELAERIRKKCGVEYGKKTRYAIEDVSCETKDDVAEKEEEKTEEECPKEIKNNEEEKEQNDDQIPDLEKPKVLIPIPGTSKMTEPYYVICDLEEARRTVREINKTQNGLTFLTLLSNTSNDEEDDNAYTTENDNFKETISDELNEKIKVDKDESRNIEEVKLRRNLRNVANPLDQDDHAAGGEPCKRGGVISLPRDIHAPYTFLKTWTTVGNDPTYKKYAHILNNINTEQIGQVIGCKLDNNMFGTILKTLCINFTVPGKVEKVHSILKNVALLPRFEIVSMLMSPQDKNRLNVLIGFLDQHDRSLPENVKRIFFQ